MRRATDRSAIDATFEPELRSLLLARFDALIQFDAEADVAELATFLVVEPGDTLADIDAALGFPVLVNRATGIRFGGPGFTPSFELAEDHGTYFELVFVLSDDGQGLEVFVTKADGVPPELLALCAAYALPAEGSQA